MWEPGPACGSPRVVMGACSHLSTGRGADPRRSSPNWSKPVLPSGSSNHPGRGGEIPAMVSESTLTAPWSKVKPIDRYCGPYQRRMYEPALGKVMSSPCGAVMRSRGAFAVCGLAAQ